MSNETPVPNRSDQSTIKIGHFNVRIVRKGDAYGRDNCLTHDEDSPLVEFYDARQYDKTFGQLGQFVSRYYCKTILEGAFPWGLSLDGGIPQWSVSSAGMSLVQEFLLNAEAALAE